MCEVRCHLSSWFERDGGLPDLAPAKKKSSRLLEVTQVFRRREWPWSQLPQNQRLAVVTALEGKKTVMYDVYLEVTYRGGRPLVAYLYPPRKKKEKSDHRLKIEPGMVLDINK